MAGRPRLARICVYDFGRVFDLGCPPLRLWFAGGGGPVRCGGVAGRALPQRVLGVATVHDTVLAGHVILVLEDEPLIALDIMQSLRGAGASVLGAGCIRDALPLACHPDLSAAILDFGLSDGDAGEVCALLDARDVPFVLYSGYQHVSEACRKGVHLEKPAGPEELVGTVVRLLQ